MSSRLAMLRQTAAAGEAAPPQPDRSDPPQAVGQSQAEQPRAAKKHSKHQLQHHLAGHHAHSAAAAAQRRQLLHRLGVLLTSLAFSAWLLNWFGLRGGSLGILSVLLSRSITRLVLGPAPGRGIF